MSNTINTQFNALNVLCDALSLKPELKLTPELTEALKNQDSKIAKLGKLILSLTLDNFFERKKIIKNELKIFYSLRSQLKNENQKNLQFLINMHKNFCGKTKTDLSKETNAALTAFALLARDSLKRADLMKDKFLYLRTIKICKFFDIPSRKFLNIWQKALVFLERFQKEKKAKYKKFNLSFIKYYDPFLREKKLKAIKLSLFIQLASSCQKKRPQIQAIHELKRKLGNMANPQSGQIPFLS